jgi:hypothetical protein
MPSSYKSKVSWTQYIDDLNPKHEETATSSSSQISKFNLSDTSIHFPIILAYIQSLSTI